MNVLRRFTLKQALLIVVPTLTTIGWCVLFALFVRTVWQDARSTYVDAHARLLTTFIDANRLSLRIGDYPELRRQLNTLEFGVEEFYVGVVDEHGAVVPANFDYVDRYRRLLAGWEEHGRHQEQSPERVVSFPDFSTSFFVFDLLLTDPTAPRPFGRLVAFVSDHTFREKENAMLWRLLWIGVVLLCVQLAVSVLVTNQLVRPLERFIHQWERSESGKAPSPEDLMQVGKSATKDVLQVSRTIGAVLARQATAVALGRFTSQIAHDMRSPLVTMQSFVRYAGNSQVDPQQLNSLREVVSKGLEKLSHMAEELLDYSRASQLVKESADIAKVCKETMSEVKTGQGTSIEWQYNGPDALAAQIDQTKIQRVLTNMLQNAAQAMPQGGTITLMLEKIVHGVQLRIRDTGCGIRPEHVAKIFESTFTFGKKQGTGLGLDYCKTVIEGHGGTIHVASVVDKGTEFTINLPAE